MGRKISSMDLAKSSHPTVRYSKQFMAQWKQIEDK